jgi:hypothetical protein
MSTTLTGIASYVQSHLYGPKWFPNVDDNVEVYVTEGQGSASINQRKYLLGQKLENHIKTFFSHWAGHFANAPEIRAISHKRVGKAGSK